MLIEKGHMQLVETVPVPHEESMPDFIYTDPAQLVLNALPEACRNCLGARAKVKDLAWTVAMGDRTSPERLAQIIRERAGCTQPDGLPVAESCV